LSGFLFIAGKNYRWRDLQFYAMNGGVCMHDEETGEFFVKTRREVLQTARGFAAEIKANKAEHGVAESDRLRELGKLVRDMIACCDEAKEQGDHTDPMVEAWFARHKPWKRSHVSMSGSGDFTAGAPAGVMAGTASSAMHQMSRGAGLPRGRINKDTIRPDRSVQMRAAAPKLVLPRVY
jgi:hypothetical protein